MLKLPKEIILEIFSYVEFDKSHKTRTSARRVCKKIYELLFNEKITRQIEPSFIQFLQRSSYLNDNPSSLLAQNSPEKNLKRNSEADVFYSDLMYIWFYMAIIKYIKSLINKSSIITLFNNEIIKNNKATKSTFTNTPTEWPSLKGEEKLKKIIKDYKHKHIGYSALSLCGIGLFVIVAVVNPSVLSPAVVFVSVFILLFALITLVNNLYCLCSANDDGKKIESAFKDVGSYKSNTPDANLKLRAKYTMFGPFQETLYSAEPATNNEAEPTPTTPLLAS